MGGSFNIMSSVTVYNTSTVSYTCNAGDTLSGTTCTHSTLVQTSPTCPSGTTFDGATDTCWTDYTISCPSGMTYDSAAGMCVAAPACANGLHDTVTDVCYQASSSSCPSGYTNNGGICAKTPSCPTEGTYDSGIDLCAAAATFSCPAGYTWNAVNSVCIATPSCANGGTLNSLTDTCQSVPGSTCDTGFTLDSGNNVCHQNPGCPTPGAYSNSLDECQASSTAVCGAVGLTLDSVNGVCFQAANCGTGSLNSVSDKCEAQATADCGAWTYDTARAVCYSTPVCADGAYKSTSNACEAAITRNCGSLYAWNASTSKCLLSPPCGNSGVFSPSLDTCLLDPAHNCPDGYSWTGLPLSVCEANPVCTDGAYNPDLDICSGDAVTCPLGDYACGDTDGSGVKRCSDLPCINLGDSANLEDESSDMTSYQDDGVIDPATGQCSGTVKIFNGRPGECLRPGLKTMFFNCCDTSVGSFLFIKEYCPEDNATTVQAEAAKTTHYVGDYCKNKIKFIGCIQKAAMYCIFNSKLARIIHEQGRSQLQKFGSSGGWGTPEGPNCEGFTPEEFQMLDFSRIDLSEFMGDINTKALNQVQQGVQDAVTNFQQNIR